MALVKLTGAAQLGLEQRIKVTRERGRIAVLQELLGSRWLTRRAWCCKKNKKKLDVPGYTYGCRVLATDRPGRAGREHERGVVMGGGRPCAVTHPGSDTCRVRASVRSCKAMTCPPDRRTPPPESGVKCPVANDNSMNIFFIYYRKEKLVRKYQCYMYVRGEGEITKSLIAKIYLQI